MNVEELKKSIAENVPNKAIESITKVVVAKKKKRGGYGIYPCVTEAKLVNIPLLGGDCMAIVFEDQRVFTVDDINGLMSSYGQLMAAYLDARNAINDFIEQNSVRIEKAIRITSDVGLVDENGNPFKEQQHSVVSLYKSPHSDEPKPWALNTVEFENITKDAWELIYNLCTDNDTRHTELPHPSHEGEVVFPYRAGCYINGLKGAALVCRTSHFYDSIIFHPKLPKSRITFVHYSCFYGIGNACGCDYEGYSRNDEEATVGRMLWVIWLSKLITEQMSIILDRTEERYDSLIKNPINSVMISEKFGFEPVEKTHAPKKPFFSRIKELFK